jgi:hypothetical protein
LVSSIAGLVSSTGDSFVASSMGAEGSNTRALLTS